MTRRTPGPASGELGNNLTSLRSERNLTQEELARLAGVSRKTINTIERGRFVPSTVLALRIAAVFQRTVEDVFWLAAGSDDAQHVDPA